MKEFNLAGSEFIELCNLLKIMDMADSGAEAKHLIAEGKVLVDGNVELRKRCKIRAGQIVKYKNEEVRVK